MHVSASANYSNPASIGDLAFIITLASYSRSLAFPVAAARVWNSLPDLVTSAPSVAVFRSRLNWNSPV